MWDFLGKVWTSINTALGLLYGTLGATAAWITGADFSISLGNNAVQFHNNPVNPSNIAGITFGNTIHYSPNVVLDCALETHERTHTYQYQWYGPLFIPVYVIISVFTGYSDHPFEQQAEAAEAYCPP